VQLRSFKHASTQEDGHTIRRKHAPAAGKRQIHARISRCESGRHSLPCVYPLRTHFAHASPLAYCCPYACVVAQVETQRRFVHEYNSSRVSTYWLWASVMCCFLILCIGSQSFCLMTVALLVVSFWCKSRYLGECCRHKVAIVTKILDRTKPSSK
jgi:hypothetical protein